MTWVHRLRGSGAQEMEYIDVQKTLIMIYACDIVECCHPWQQVLVCALATKPCSHMHLWLADSHGISLSLSNNELTRIASQLHMARINGVLALARFVYNISNVIGPNYYSLVNTLLNYDKLAIPTGCHNYVH